MNPNGIENDRNFPNCHPFAIEHPFEGDDHADIEPPHTGWYAVLVSDEHDQS